MILNSHKIDIFEEDLSVETIKNIMPKKYHELIDETEDLVVKRIYESKRIEWGKGGKLFQLETLHIQSHRILLRGQHRAL